MSGNKKDPEDPKDKRSVSAQAKSIPSGPPEDITKVPPLTFSDLHHIPTGLTPENPESTQPKPAETKK